MITTKRNPTFTALLEHPHIQMRCPAKLGVDHSLLRAGDGMLFTFFIQPASQEPLAVLKLDRSQNDGLFDRLTHGYTRLWEEAAQTITTPEQPHATRPNTDSAQRDQNNAKSAGEPGARGQQTTAKPGDPTSPAQPATDDDTKPPPRRWPRRPD